MSPRYKPRQSTVFITNTPPRNYFVAVFSFVDFDRVDLVRMCYNQMMYRYARGEDVRIFV